VRVSVTGPITDADSAWGCVSETDVMLRLAGAPPVRLRWAEDADGEVVPTGTMLGPAGLRHRFVDRSLVWVRGRFLRFVRVVEGPLLREIRYEAVLEDAGAGVRPTVVLDVTPTMVGIGAFVRLYTRGVRKGWTRELERTALSAEATRPPRRSIDMTTTAAISRWVDRGARPALRARVEAWMRHAPPGGLSELRPLALARGWADPRTGQAGAILDDLVEAAAAGVLELRWVVMCPRCRAEVLRTETLSGLPELARCATCAAVRTVDLARTVEVLLQAPSWLEAREPTCHSLASRWPDAVAAALLAPGATVELPLNLPFGRYRIVSGAGAEPLDGGLVVTPDGPEAARWTPGDGEVRMSPGVLVLSNTTPRRHFLRIVRESPEVPNLSAFSLLTRARFQRRLGGQAPAPDVVLEVSDATVFFTDLTDSTEYFERFGDRVAVQHIRARLDDVEEVVQACGGVRVKTLGDGVLALFPTPAGAVRAALDLLGSPLRGLPGEPQLRVGISRGPILTEHTDAAGLDCLGATVAAAARAVYGAAPRSARWTSPVDRDLEVQKVLRASGVEPQQSVNGMRQLHADTLPSPPYRSSSSTP
jgi:class 3 adenylate cyclase